MVFWGIEWFFENIGSSKLIRNYLHYQSSQTYYLNNMMAELHKKYSPDLYFIKENVEKKEYLLHKYIYKLGIVNVPKIYHYDSENGYMVMQRIRGMSISDLYGEEAGGVSADTFERIRAIVQQLYNNQIEYSDITGYNFIEWNGKLWIVDFGHANYIAGRISNRFLLSFLSGKNKWNPAFL